jgi:hypothetical protein
VPHPVGFRHAADSVNTHPTAPLFPPLRRPPTRSYARNVDSGRWFNFNDASASEVGSAADSLGRGSGSAYLLFYVKRRG